MTCSLSLALNFQEEDQKRTMEWPISRVFATEIVGFTLLHDLDLSLGKLYVTSANLA